MSQLETRAQKIAKTLKKLRNQVGYTQQEIADKIGSKQQTYAGYESGRHEPSVEMLIRIADLFDVSMDFIVARESDMNDADNIDRYLEDREKLKIKTMDNILELIEQRVRQSPFKDSDDLTQ